MSRNRIFLCVFGISVCFVAGIAARLQGEGIVDGEIAEPNQFPYQVSLTAYGQSICGGGIIGDRYVLTAAHCVVDEDGEFMKIPMVVVAGINDQKNRFTESVRASVEKIYVPSVYPFADNGVGDIAVLKLEKSLHLKENKKLAELSLPVDSEKSYAYETVKIAGFGWDWAKVYRDPFNGPIEDGGFTNSKLKFANAIVVSQTLCQKLYGNRRPIDDTQICAKVKQQDGKRTGGVCSGDSGGPLVYNGETVIGVVSTSPIGCRESFVPAVYTRVSSYVDFIKNAKNDKISRDIRTYSFKTERKSYWPSWSSIFG